MAAAGDIVADIDRRALALRRKVTRSLAAEALAALRGAESRPVTIYCGRARCVLTSVFVTSAHATLHLPRFSLSVRRAGASKGDGQLSSIKGRTRSKARRCLMWSLAATRNASSTGNCRGFSSTRRVLEEAQNTRHPLLERLRFLSISASNLDEFYMVRVAGLHGQVVAKVQGVSQDGLTPEQQLTAINRMVATLSRDQQAVWTLLKAEMEVSASPSSSPGADQVRAGLARDLISSPTSSRS